MAFNENNGNGFIMPVVPSGYGYGFGGNNGNNGFGGDLSWLLILFLFALMGGWGGMGMGMGGFGMGMGGWGMGGMFPWLLASNANTDNLVQGGFNQAATAGSLAGIQSSITNGFGNAEIAACGRAADAMQTAYNNQIASMNQEFANSQALDSRLDALAMALQNCCCENRAAVADLKYTVATEACADRAAVNDALRDVLTANTANTQRILDKLCDQELMAKQDRIDDLERQLTMSQLAASQTAQTAAIRAGQVAEIDAMYNRLRDCPVPTQPVYGSQPIFTCPVNNNNFGGCGCGCGGVA